MSGRSLHRWCEVELPIVPLFPSRIIQLLSDGKEHPSAVPRDGAQGRHGAISGSSQVSSGGTTSGELRADIAPSN